MFAIGEKTVNQKITKHEIVCKHIVHEGRRASVHRLMRTRLYITKWYNRGPDQWDYVAVIRPVTKE